MKTRLLRRALSDPGRKQRRRELRALRAHADEQWAKHALAVAAAAVDSGPMYMTIGELAEDPALVAALKLFGETGEPQDRFGEWLARNVVVGVKP
jgi:hypothetical protein